VYFIDDLIFLQHLLVALELALFNKQNY